MAHKTHEGLMDAFFQVFARENEFGEQNPLDNQWGNSNRISLGYLWRVKYTVQGLYLCIQYVHIPLP